MAWSRPHTNKYSRLFSVVAAAGLLFFAVTASTRAAFAATTTYTLKNLSATVTGTSVTATATVAASVKTTARYAGVCVRDANGNNYDFNKGSYVVLTTTGTVLNAPAQTLSTGTYSYFACIYVSSTWYMVGVAKSFTVGSQTTPTTYTLNNLSATVTGTSVTATATVAASVDTTAQSAGICVRDSSNNNFDFPMAQNVDLTTTGTVLSGAAQTLAAGTYTYYACIIVQNVASQVGNSQSFTVSSTTGSGSGSGTGTSTPPSGSSYGNNALAQWNTALTNRNTAPVTWVAWGDSITEGQGASTIQNRWVNQTTDGLRTKYPTSGVTGGLGYQPSYHATYGPDSTWTPFSSEGGSIYDDNWGSLGERIADLGTGGYETYTVNGTSADIMYTTNGGTFTYRVDSGTPVTVNTAGTYTPTGSTHVAFTSAGTHTVTVTSTSGTVYFEGIMEYNGDENKGIRLYEGGHSGATSGDFLNSAWDMAAITDSVKADLVTIQLGPNDFLHSASTPSQLTSNLQSMISDIRASSSDHEPSIVVVVTYSAGTYANSAGYTWQQYADAIRAVANADPSVGLLDLSSFGVAGSDPSLVSPTDGLHPSDTGQAKLATMVESYLEDQ